MIEYVEFEDVTVVAASERAIKVIIPDLDDEPLWVPRKVIADYSDVQDVGTEGTLVVRESWAKKEGHI